MKIVKHSFDGIIVGAGGASGSLDAAIHAEACLSMIGVFYL